MVSETKLGCCKYCGSKYHRGWQCHQKPKKDKKQSSQKTREKHKNKRSIIIKDFDKVYSRYLRMSQINKYNHCFCFICGKRLTFEQACIGHYISRRYISTRFDERNANVICYQCNMIDNKQKAILEKYAKRLEEEYHCLDYLNLRKNYKMPDIELEYLYQFYKDKLKKEEAIYKKQIS